MKSKVKKCDFYAVLGFGKFAQFVCTVTYRHGVKCDGCANKCHCPKKAEQCRKRILERLNGKKR